MGIDDFHGYFLVFHFSFFMIKKALRGCIFTLENYSDRGLPIGLTTIEIDQLPQAANLGLFTSYTRMTPGLASQRADRDTT
jgi:hypothetical protein